MPALQTEDDAPLLRRARTGDRAALRQVAEAWWPRMRRWAWWELGDRELAEDAVQDALVRLVRFIDRWDPERAFDTWLRTLVRNACRDARGRRGLQAQRETSPIERGRRDGVERRLDLDRAARRAVAAIGGLAPRQRELLLRVDRGGEAPVDVARELGISPGAVRNQLHTARRNLRARLLAEGNDVIQLLRDA